MFCIEVGKATKSSFGNFPEDIDSNGTKNFRDAIQGAAP